MYQKAQDISNNMTELTTCTFVNACNGKIEMISDYAISVEDNGLTFLKMVCAREERCIYQTKLMYNNEILIRDKPIIEQCDISEHKLTLQLIKLHNETIFMKDLEWTVGVHRLDTHNEGCLIATVPQAKTMNIICEKKIYPNVYSVACRESRGWGYLTIEEHDGGTMQFKHSTMPNFHIQIIDPTFRATQYRKL